MAAAALRKQVEALRAEQEIPPTSASAAAAAATAFAVASARQPTPLPLPPRDDGGGGCTGGEKGEDAAAAPALSTFYLPSPPSPSSVSATETREVSFSAARAEADEVLRRLSGKREEEVEKRQHFSPSAPGRRREAKKRFANGSVAVAFPGGGRKLTFPDGRSITLFANGDMRRSWPVRRTEGEEGEGEGGEEDEVFEKRASYYFFESDVWNTTLVSKSSSRARIEVYHFASGQVEAHLPCGSKHVLLPEAGGGGGEEERGGGRGREGRFFPPAAAGSADGGGAGGGGGGESVPLERLCPWALLAKPESTDAERLWRGEW